MNDYTLNRIDDIDLAAALAAALQSDSAVPAEVTVDVSGGVVKLEGEVERPHQRKAAETLVLRFGVAAVVNTITVKHMRHSA